MTDPKLVFEDDGGPAPAPDTESRSIEDVLTDEDRERLDEAHKDAAESD